MDQDLDPSLKRIINGAAAINSQDRSQRPFQYASVDTRPSGWNIRPPSWQSPQESLPFDDLGQAAFTFEPYSHQSISALNPGRSRLSLGPRNIYNQSETDQGMISNADNHFRVAHTQRQGVLAGQAQPRLNGIQQQSPITHLANNMLLHGSGQQSSPEPPGFFHGLRSRKLNPLQLQTQQVTPPFNLSGFVHSPNTHQPSFTSSPPATEMSSPTTRISLRRGKGHLARLSASRDAEYDFDDQVSAPETPRRHTAVSAITSTPKALALGHAPPMAHGIQLISPHDLPDRFRQIFPHELFNAVQSKCFAPIYRTNDNVLISAPTGSGKTALLELAICKLVEGHSSGQFKIVYQAPTKSLCSERIRDWQKKFSNLNLLCAELTGDTSQAEMSKVRDASIIITTPEKWDCITRKWKDYNKLLQMVKLFLIDEVHILKDIRGATLEAVVSRMKTIGVNVRFVALSATVPNSQDIALWLGKDHTNSHLPAHRETFSEDFRPVKLQKHVHGFDGQMNDFAFEKVLDGKLPALISKYTHKKPIMVFCFTRKSCESTASMLAEWWGRQKVGDRAWPAPVQRTVLGSKELRELAGCGVAFHHAGLEGQDRNAIEMAFLKGDISLICCTSTLAVGVNLPCHLVVLKGTVGFQDGALCEYSDLEVMQMLGRAGRPQFDSTAVAIIMTRSDKTDRYKKMICGQDVLESTLHLNLIEHLNSEIGLGTVRDVYSAKQWLAGTFLSVRMRQNPKYYNISGIATGGDSDARLELVCERDIKLLQDAKLVTEGQRFDCTEYGEAMSRYMVQFETMKLLLSIPAQAKTEQILHIICQASEFKDLRMKPNERAVLREFNKSSLIKYPIKENISTTAQKIFLVIQVQLGGVEFPTDNGFVGIKRRFMTEKSIIFDRVQRLIRCVVDCKSFDCDAISTRHALDLARSLSAEYWEYSNLQLRQVAQVGPVALRKLATNSVNSVEKLMSLDTASIERIMGKNPPFGKKIQDSLVNFPRLSLVAEIVGRAAIKLGEFPRVSVRAVLGFTNSKVPAWLGRKPSLNFTAETSKGTLVHFWRGNIHRLEKGYELRFVAELSDRDDEVKCYVSCDEIVGTVRSCTLKPNIPISAFPAPKVSKQAKTRDQPPENVATNGDDEFGDDEIRDDEMLAAASGIEASATDYGSDGFTDFADIDDFDGVVGEGNSKKGLITEDEVTESVQMANGKWSCNHRCCGEQTLKNGKLCKHRCCREGLDKPRKIHRRKPSIGMGDVLDQFQDVNEKLLKKSQPARNTMRVAGGTNASAKRSTLAGQRSLPKMAKHSNSGQDDVELIDLAKEDSPFQSSDLATRDNGQRKSRQKGKFRITNQKPQFSYASGQQPDLAFLRPDHGSHSAVTDIPDWFDSGNSPEDEFPSPSALLRDDFVADPFEAGLITYRKATPTPLQDDGSLENLEEEMIVALEDPVTLKMPSPKASSSFANSIFDFSAFPDEEKGDIQQPLPHVVGSLKRGLSPSAEGPALKHIRTVRKVASAEGMSPHQTTKEQRSVPAWIDEFDSELIEGLRDIVDFVD